MQPLLHIAVNAARLAGDVIVRSLETLDRLTIHEKSPNDFYSEVDLRAEEIIIKTIQKAYPHHGILAEESGTRNPDAESVWIIDPLDGTTNFIHGFPFYAVSIALRVKNRIEHGVVYDPIRHECFSASRGAGARLNDRRIRVSKETKLLSALLGTGFPTRNPALVKRYLPTFEAMFDKCSGMRRTGSAALDLAYVAAGRLDGFWQFGLRPWDMAAASLIIQEAGGLIGDNRGGENFLQEGNVVAGNPKIFKALLQTISPFDTAKSEN